MADKRVELENHKDHDEEVQINLQGLSERVRASTRQIWLAGLGAFTKAEEDAGKLFNKLVNEGEELEGKTRVSVKKQIKMVEGTVEEVKTKASGTIDKLESLFDQRVSKAMSRLGIPTRKELAELEERIAKLENLLKQDE